METNKIYQGDCLELMKKIEDNSIDLILCDLPYGSTQCSWDVIIPFDKLWEQYNRIIKENGAIVLTSIQPFTTLLVQSNFKDFKYCWYWDRCFKSNFLNAKKQPIRHIETICIFYDKQPNYNPQLKDKRKDQIRWNNIPSKGIQPKTTGKLKGMRNRFDNRIIPLDKDYPTELLIFSLSSANKGRLHPTQKPVALFEYLIRTYTNEGDLVLDNCIGSGTTAVACINTKRNFIGMELSPEYCKIANDRLTKKTGGFFSSQP